MTHKMLTREGAEKLSKELKLLRDDQRARAIEAIKEARDSPDFLESSLYVQAIERREAIDRRIEKLERTLLDAEIVDVEKVDRERRVVFGSTVTVCGLPQEESVRYRLVGEDEADIASGKLSITAPLAQAILGREEHDLVRVEAPGGPRMYRIVGIGRGR